jgi:hypothetical protein
MWAGLILSGTLGIKTVAMPVGIGSDNLYAVSWDHALVSIGPFTATMMLCVGFMQIFADQDQFGMIAMQLQWAREQELLGELIWPPTWNCTVIPPYCSK